MKTKIRIFMLAGLFSIISSVAGAQDKQSTPPWVCEKGYWVAESNVNSPKQHTIWFYNDQHVLIGRKDLSGVKLNLRKKKTRMQLKAALQTSLDAWTAGEKEAISPVASR